MAKKPKNEYASKEPFSLPVCNRLRWCVGMRAKLVGERKEAFEKRDALNSQLMQLTTAALAGGVSSAEITELKAKAFDSERNIEHLQHQINFFGKTITETVQEADSPELDGMMDEMPIFAPPPPKAKEPSKPKQPDAEHADGVDEHLSASINELDLPELQKGRLVKGGFETIGALAKFVDDGKDLRAHLEIGENIASQINKALKVYRSTHIKASLQVEREAVGA